MVIYVDCCDHLFGKDDGKVRDGFADIITVDPVGHSTNCCAAIDFSTGFYWMYKDGLIPNSNVSAAAYNC